jgi:hypothetical protein
MDTESGKGLDSEAKKPAEKPISLHPLKFEEAVRDLLRVVHPRKGVGDGGRRREGD